MSNENLTWGAPRIHGELLMLGLEVSESTVGRYMIRTGRPRSQGWKTFLHNHTAGIASLDLFVVRTISFKLLYGLVVLRHARRQLVRIAVTSNPTAEWITGQVTEAFPWDEAPRHLLRDRDCAFGTAYSRRIRAMGIRDHRVGALALAKRTRRAADRLDSARMLGSPGGVGRGAPAPDGQKLRRLLQRRTDASVIEQKYPAHSPCTHAVYNIIVLSAITIGVARL
jgi:hypothetical protein